MYQPFALKANYSSKIATLAIEAQGGLFAVAFRSQLPAQQKFSCAHDHQKYQRAYNQAFAALVKREQVEQFWTIEWKHPSAFPVPAASDPRQQILLEAGTLVSRPLAAALSAFQRSQIDADTWRILNEVPAPPRGRITEFSAKSRLRLMKWTARLNQDVRGLFLTITYRQNQRDHAQAKYHLDLLLHWLKNHYPQGAFLWRMEYQRRGAIHFHILALNVQFIDAERLTAAWHQIAWDDSYPDIDPIHNRRHAMHYVAKYIAKVPEADARLSAPHWLFALAFRLSPRAQCALALGFIPQPYSEMPSAENCPGRFWGIANRKNLPLAPRFFMLVQGAAYAFHEIRRLARRKYKKMSRRYQGFALFVNDARQWFDVFDALRQDDFLSMEIIS